MAKQDEDVLGRSTERELREAVLGLHVWKRRGQRAPHKPLLLLLSLGRLQRGEPRLTTFPEIEGHLRLLLEEFGPPRKSYHPEFPFWHLRTDGLWEVQGAERLPLKKAGSSPSAGVLRDAEARGGLQPSVFRLLAARPPLLRWMAEILLEEHFPASYHDAILAAVGLSLDPETERTRRRKRDAEFPVLVLRAYEYRCAVCGLDAQLDGRSVGLEAAHVRWHSHGGDSIVANGICACPLHHRAFDFGGIGISEHHRVIASSRLHGGDVTRELLLRYHGAPLRRPQRGEPPVDLANIRWHLREVFRGPPRA
jgi:putative restriction endonuclease